MRQNSHREEGRRRKRTEAERAREDGAAAIAAPSPFQRSSSLGPVSLSGLARVGDAGGPTTNVLRLELSRRGQRKAIGLVGCLITTTRLFPNSNCLSRMKHW